MYTVEYRTQLDLDREAAWSRLRDLSVADRYVPGLTAVELTTAQREGVGASRRVFQGKRLALDETVTEWNEGSGFSLRLHRGDKGPVPPMREAWFDYGLEVEGERVYLHNRMRYSLGGWLGPLLQALLIGRIAAGAVRDTTIAQKLFYESGEPVSPRQLKAARQRLATGG